MLLTRPAGLSWISRTKLLNRLKKFTKYHHRLKRGETALMTFCLLLCLFSCSKKEEYHSREEVIVEKILPEDITLKTETIVDSLITSMTLEEMVGQCLMPSIDSKSDSTNLAFLNENMIDYHIGGIVLLKGTAEGVENIRNISKESNIPLFISIDAEWGLGMRLKDGAIYPKNGKIGSETDESYLYDYGRNVAKDARAIGINMILGPVLDISAQASGPYGFRSYGDDAEKVSSFGISYAKGLESGGVISVAKHFPGHGSSLFDSHRKAALIERNITTLDSIDLKPFKDYINAGLTAIMVGHIKAPALDPTGTIASASSDIMTSLLREEMNFKGLILTDAFNMKGADGYTAGDALKAGADIVICPSDISKEYKTILCSIEAGKLDVAVIKDRCKRILFYKYLLEL